MARATEGSIAIVAAIALPVLLLIVGGSIDFAHAILQRQQLQAVVDSATLAAGRELSMADARRENVASVVQEMVLRMVAANGAGNAPPTIRTSITSDPMEVTVVATQATRPLFGGAFGLAPGQLQVGAVARVIGRPNICVLALDSGAMGAISLEKNALVTGKNCAVFSNSTHANGLKSKNSASLTASMICTAGGKDGGPGNFFPEPLIDCPTFDDPLASRPEPVPAKCPSNAPTTIEGPINLAAGTFCGGLSIKRGAHVSLAPGIYVVKDGPLTVEDGASLTGAGVGIYLTGVGAILTFARGSSIDLQAATDGAMAGILIFEGRAQPTSAKHQILSDDARTLLGTLYMPRGTLHIDANAPIADKSAYTAIVARMLTLFGGPNLVLNTNYDLTDVPVPEGIRGAGQPVQLVK